MIDARYIRTQSSGIGRYTEQSIRELAKLDDQLHLHLITHPEDPEPFGDHARITHTVFDAPANSVATRRALGALVNRHAPQLFHSPFNFLPAGLDVPAIFTLHDIMWLMNPAYCTESRVRRLVQGTFYGHVIPRSIHEASQLLTVSHHSREAIEARFPEVQGNVHVSYNGLDPFFCPLPEDEAWSLISRHIPPRRKFVLIVGQGSPYKNHAGALEGFLRAFANDPEIYVVLVRRFTRGPSKRLAALMRTPALNSRLITLEYLSGMELRALYSAAQCFLFPSLYEGFGLPPLEAMACGTPVVTSGIGAPAEVCGPAAELVDPDDPDSIAHGLRRVMCDEAHRDDLIARGLSHAQSFTWRRCAEQILHAYRRTLDAHA